MKSTIFERCRAFFLSCLNHSFVLFHFLLLLSNRCFGVDCNKNRFYKLPPSTLFSKKKEQKYVEKLIDLLKWIDQMKYENKLAWKRERKVYFIGNQWHWIIVFGYGSYRFIFKYSFFALRVSLSPSFSWIIHSKVFTCISATFMTAFCACSGCAQFWQIETLESRYQSNLPPNLKIRLLIGKHANGDCQQNKQRLNI